MTITLKRKNNDNDNDNDNDNNNNNNNDNNNNNTNKIFLPKCTLPYFFIFLNPSPKLLLFSSKLFYQNLIFNKFNTISSNIFFLINVI